MVSNGKSKGKNNGIAKRHWEAEVRGLYKSSEKIGDLLERERNLNNEVESLLTARLDVLSRMKTELREGSSYLAKQ